MPAKSKRYIVTDETMKKILLKDATEIEAIEYASVVRNPFAPVRTLHIFEQIGTSTLPVLRREFKPLT